MGNKKKHVNKKSVPADFKKKRSFADILMYNKYHETRIYLILSFLIPFIIIWIMFAQFKVHPFGDQQILVTDLWHQYFPFFQEEHEKLQNLSSLLYSWNTGLGTNFLSVMSYYAASPLNILAVFFPLEYSRDVMTLFLTIKIGCAGLFFAIFLKTIFKRNDISITAFSVCYALCSYIMGYYWNLIWIDTVALLPLVVMGTILLVKEGKYKVYVISLTLSLVANFYIGLFTCIFTVMVFAAAAIINWRGIKGTLIRLGQMIGVTAIGIGMGAFMLLPAYMALQLTNSVDNQFPTVIEFYESWLKMISNVIGFHEPTAKEGLPNFYCGMFGVILIGVFLRNNKIKIREKIITVLYIAFIIVSCNMNVLNYMWHGFHFTNMLPYRFSFLLSFILVAAGYRAFTVMRDDIKMFDVIALSAMTVIIALVSFRDQSESAVIASIVVCLIYVAIMFVYERKLINKNMLNYLVFGVCVIEMGVNAYKGVETVSVTGYSIYPKNYDSVEAMIDAAEEDDKDGFYRLELTSNYSINDPALYGYRGVSQFSSTANVSVTRFLESLGIQASAAGNRYYYTQSTPINNMFLNIEYLISHDGFSGDETYLDRIDDDGSVVLYKNNAYLPIAFTAESSIMDYQGESKIAFENQNELFRLATGLEEDVFTPIDVKDVGHKGLNVIKTSNGQYSYQYSQPDDGSSDCYLKYNFTVEHDGPVYASFFFDNATGYTVKNGDSVVHNYGQYKYKNTFAAGNFKAGDVISFYANIEKDKSGTGSIYVYQADEELLRQGVEKLSAGGIDVTSYDDTRIEGSFTAENDGVLYTSIPYDGGWKVYIDGKETEVTGLKDAMVCIPVTAGTHDIKLKYCPPGFAAGTVISISSVAVFAALWVIQKKYMKKKKTLSDGAEENNA
ncbi:YfhO family protein [Porcipelethomonas sp.]|uniref:YfhO family protein n=1 Tax=Porcipelethomonas sp. TaxID=2981675 RepID=UPI003EF699C5